MWYGRFPRLWRHGGLGRGRRLDNVGLGFTTLRIHAGVAPCWLTTLRISTPPTAHMHRNLPSCWLLPFPVSATRSAEHPSELNSLMRISSAVFCLPKHQDIRIYNTR